MFYTVCVTSATIYGVENGSTVGSKTFINCTADDQAYPPASYRWTSNNDISVTNPAVSQIVLQPGTEYKLTCTASNNFDRCSATVYVEFNSKLTLYFSVVCDVVVP